MTRRFKILGSLVLLTLVAALLWRAVLVLQRDRPLDARHEPRAWDESFDYANADFAAYQAWAGRQLQRGLQAETLPHALAPYRLDPPAGCPVPADRPWYNGIVLMHDLQTSPYQWWSLARWLQQRCFVVLVPLLPGHGSVPGDLLRSRWQDWRALQALATRELAGQVSNLFLAGHGAGATLALLEAADNPAVDALLLFAPVLQRRPLPWYAPLAGALAGVLPAAAWGEIRPDTTPYRHDSWPLALGQQLNALVAATQPRLAEAGAGRPVFALASSDDAVAPAPAILDFMRGQRHPDSRTLLFTRELLPEAPGLQQVSTRRPDLGLQGLGHDALIVSLGDPVFGQFGTYHDCRHYYRRDAGLWERCSAGEYELQGVPEAETLASGLLRQPGFNFFYDRLLQELEIFVAPVAAAAAGQAL